MTSQSEPQVMLDPSLLVQPRAFSIVEEVLEQGDERFAAPATFLEAVREGEVSDAVLGFFGAPRIYPFQADAFSRRVTLATRFVEPWQPRPADPEVAGYGSLDLPDLHPQLAAIANEEWSFIHERSWIAARSRKTFDLFIEGGAAAVEFSRKHFDELVSRTLARTGHEVPSAVSPKHRLRAAAKWVAGAGPSWTAFVDPALAGVLGSLGAAYFFLFDP